MIPVVYYAHSMRIYNTIREQHELEIIHHYFWQSLIFNPNRGSIQHATNPMQACLDIVNDESVKQLVFSEVDGCIEQGVYAEIQLAKRHEIPIFVIEHNALAPVDGVFKKIPGKKNKYKRQT